ncbi:MAG TPA: hypothetical protein VK638_43195 [Edaphobacter sp.]|nr:hypothetical protein [Edaphobacter sp.]
MKNAQEVEQLTAEITLDEKRYRTTVQVEGRIFEATAGPGFAAAWERIRLLSEMQALAENIRRNKIILASARS